MKTICITVKGDVQGVFYRQTTKEKALDLGITGKVMNLENGDVRVIASGDEEKLNKLVEWCRQGPPRASVQEVSVEQMPLTGFDEFRIVRS